MIQVLVWYLLLLFLGLAALPIATTIFPALTDKGYAFSKSLGLFLWGFLYWLLCIFGILQNNLGGAITALIFVLFISLAVSLWKKTNYWSKLWKEQRSYALVIEGIFVLSFVLIAFWRAANPDIVGTEKPMELAFINAILRSPTFPPIDPWLSGYSISYYYFGYVLISLMIRVSGVVSGVGFSLAAATVFSLAAIGLYGLVFDIIHEEKLARLLGLNHSGDTHKRNSIASYLLPVLAPMFTLIISNMEGLLEFLHARGIFWQRSVDGTLTSTFWKWLSVQELTSAPVEPLSWWPVRPGGVIWWRASRVLTDFNVTGRDFEIIDEFPFFSFLLSDLHPHVLAIPFAILCLGLALNLLLGGNQGKTSIIGIVIPLPPATVVTVPVLIGGMMFLNTWDFPIYLGVYLLCILFIQIQKSGWSREIFWEFIATGIILGGVSIVIYLPFLIGFKSQAGGIIPSMIFSTRGAHFWVMFGILLIPILFFLMVYGLDPEKKPAIRKGLIPVGIFILAAGIISLIIGWLGTFLSGWGSALIVNPSPVINALGYKLSELGNAFRDLQGIGAEPGYNLVLETVVKRLTAPGAWITLLVLGTLVIGYLLLSIKKENQQDQTSNPQSVSSGLVFILILILSGGIIAVTPEFFYLRDQFGWRMNTIFKFYYQVWIIWSIAAAVCTIYLLRTLRGAGKIIGSVVLGLTIFAGLLYPILGTYYTTNGYHPDRLTLDGNDHLARFSPDEDQAMKWLSNAPFGVIAESVGGSYSAHARMSTHSGLPTVIGWVPHEGQWGRGPEELGSRMPDIETLYATPDWDAALTILNLYKIRYIVIGDLERTTYQVDETKFQTNLPVVFENNRVRIYEFTGK